MAPFVMPKLSDTMEEGTILQWLVADGDTVTKGQDLVEVETDKANMMVQAPEAGIVTLLAGEGDVLEVGEPMAMIGGGGDQTAAYESTPVTEADGAPPGGAEDDSTGIPTAADGTADEIGAALDLEETYPGARAADAAESAAPVPAEPVAAPEPEPEPEPAPGRAPRARGWRPRRWPGAWRGRWAWTSPRSTGPDPTGAWSAPTSRPPRAERRARSAPRPRRPRPPSHRRPRRRPQGHAAPPAAAGERIPLSRLQRTVAARMARSSAEAPQFALQRDVDATEALTLRRQLVEAAPEGSGPSLNDLIVRAVAMAAAEQPDAVSRFDGDALVRPPGIHVGIAVAVERGLLVPVVRDADTKGIGQIAQETRDLAARARDGSITPAELEGSVISISNLGMFGIDRFTAIINPPETAILAVGRAAPRPVVRDGEVVVRQVMTLTLSVDHRAVYGAEGAVLLGRVAELLERPGALVL